MEKRIARVYYLDWLRVLAFWLLILFHTWQPFNHFHWLIKSHNQNVLADILTVFTHGWRLHLIFLVSGVGTWFAMRSHKQSFFKDRFKRLIIPFKFASIFFSPPQRYFQELQSDQTTLGIWNYLIQYPTQLAQNSFGFDVLLWFKEIGIHVWYLPYLLVMTLVTYPLLSRIGNGQIGLDKIYYVISKPFGIFILAIPIFIFRLVFKPIFPSYTGWADFLTYLWPFVYGYVLINDHKNLIVVIQKNKIKLLMVGLISSLILIIGSSQQSLVDTYLNPRFNVYHLLISTLSALIALSWPLYFVALFSQRLNRNANFLSEANASILPVYVFHQSIIVVAGYYVLDQNLQGIIEFLLIAAFTMISCVIFYITVKRINVARYILGMNLLKKT